MPHLGLRITGSLEEAVRQAPSTSKKYGDSLRTQMPSDHAIGKVRGLLCNHCTRAPGFFQGDAETLLAAYKYLKHASE